MYDFAIVNGDLQLDYNGDIGKVSSSDRIRQELKCWLLEPLGTDKMYKRFGSSLNSYIGGIENASLISVVEAELNRVVSNYIAYYNSQFNTASSRGVSYLSSAFDGDCLIRGMPIIDIETVADGVRAVIKLQTTSGTIDVEHIL